MKKVFLCISIILALGNKALALYYTCVINTSTLVFGNIVPFDFTNTDSNVNVTVTCTKTVPGLVYVDYTLKFSPGGSNNQLDRKMSSLDDHTLKLKYNIYKNNARTRILGDGTQGTRTWRERYWLTNNKPSRPRTRRIKGRVPVQPNAAVGSYKDTIEVCVDYNNQ